MRRLIERSAISKVFNSKTKEGADSRPARRTNTDRDSSRHHGEEWSRSRCVLFEVPSGNRWKSKFVIDHSDGVGVVEPVNDKRNDTQFWATRYLETRPTYSDRISMQLCRFLHLTLTQEPFCFKSKEKSIISSIVASYSYGNFTMRLVSH